MRTRVGIPSSHVNAGSGWWPTCNPSFRSWLSWAGYSLVRHTSLISELWIQVKDPVLIYKVKINQEIHLGPAEIVQQSRALAAYQNS